MAPASLEGQTLGKYRVLEQLGRGGMAQVYRGYHPQLDRYAAIQVLRPDVSDDEEFIARFDCAARCGPADPRRQPGNGVGGSITGNWDIFGRGWPVEVFLVSILLATIMVVTSSIWLLIPAGIVIGNGLILATARSPACGDTGSACGRWGRC